MRVDDLERAIRFQQRHFEQITEADDAEPSECVQAGLWLAELLLEDDERLEAGIDCLEHLLATYEDVELFATVRRKLAYAYVELGNAYCTKLGDLETAYSLKWQIVDSGHATSRDLDDLVDLAFDGGWLEGCAERLEELAERREGQAKLHLLERAAQVVDEDLMWPEEAVRLYGEALELCDEEGDARLELMRRRAFCLSQIAGREQDALEEFRTLATLEPFEPTTYRGMSDLLDRSRAFDRARISRQILRVLDCEVELNEPRTKTAATRAITDDEIAEHLLPEALCGGVLDVLRSAMPLADKVWSAELPQQKAMEGTRLSKLEAVEAEESLQNALEAFGITRFKAESGDSGPATPQVFGGSTPQVWLNLDHIEQMEDAELRFVAGYCAALAWSGLPTLLELDGRRVWHLIEAVQLKQTDRGFSDRVDMTTQDLVEQVSSPFHAVARRRLMGALEPIADTFDEVHCEQWPAAVEQFACRVGLVLAGDVRAAVRGLLQFHGWELPLDAPETQKRIRRREDIRQLIAYSISDEYLEARHAMGLAGKPSVLSV